MKVVVEPDTSVYVPMTNVSRVMNLMAGKDRPQSASELVAQCLQRMCDTSMKNKVMARSILMAVASAGISPSDGATVINALFVGWPNEIKTICIEAEEGIIGYGQPPVKGAASFAMAFVTGLVEAATWLEEHGQINLGQKWELTQCLTRMLIEGARLTDAPTIGSLSGRVSNVARAFLEKVARGELFDGLAKAAERTDAFAPKNLAGWAGEFLGQFTTRAFNSLSVIDQITSLHKGGYGKTKVSGGVD